MMGMSALFVDPARAGKTIAADVVSNKSKADRTESIFGR